MTHERWHRAGSFAARQYGLITYEQLLACGCTPKAIEQACLTGRLVQVHRRVYSLGHPPIDRRAHLLAAPLALGPASAVSHGSSAEHLGILERWRSEVEVTVPGHGGRSHRRITVHRCLIAPDERRSFEGIPCTEPSRTIIDIAATQPHRLERAIRAAGGAGILAISRILELLDRYPRRRGSRLVRMALEGNEPLPVFNRSELERRMFELCRDASLPLPAMNVDIDAEGGPYEVDCVWFRHRLIVECDSRWHDNPISARKDASQDEALTLAGWRVHRFRWHQIVGDPERTARTIRLLLAEQERLLGVALPR
jgi:very-short-patch-repair endonuclease